MDNQNTIYTRDEAAIIIERFEQILNEYKIRIPSSKGENNKNSTGLYSVVYKNLLDDIENYLIYFLTQAVINRPNFIFNRSRGEDNI